MLFSRPSAADDDGDDDGDDEQSVNGSVPLTVRHHALYSTGANVTEKKVHLLLHMLLIHFFRF